MKFLLFVNVAAVLWNLWNLLAIGYTDLHFVGMSMSFVAMIMAICMLVEDR
jgi:hypothetical protein